MSAVPLGLQSYNRARGIQPETRLVNLYLEEDDSGASPDQIYRLQRPGLTKLVTFPAPIRGIYQSDNVLNSLTVVVAGDRLYTTDLGTITDIGPITLDGDSVTIAATFERVGICTAGEFWSYDGETLEQIELPDGQPIVDLDVINSYFVAGLSDGRFFWLVPGASAWDALDFATAESLPDAIIAVRRLKDDLFFIGSRSIEVWQATGDANATFQRAPGRLIDRGCMSRDTVAMFDNSLVFVGEDGLVYRIADVPQRISTFGIEERIRKRTDLCSAFVFTSEGHKFYCLRIPGQCTVAYDASSKAWCEFSTLNQTVWAPSTGLDTNGGPLCGDAAGKLYLLDADAATDDGVAIQRLVTGTIALPATPVRNNALAVGVGCDDPAAFTLRYRDARDDNWSDAINLPARHGSDVLNVWRAWRDTRGITHFRNLDNGGYQNPHFRCGRERELVGLMPLPKFLRIARLIAGNRIVDPATGNPTTGFMRSINDAFGMIESAVNSIKQQADDILFSLQQAGIAITNAAEAHALAVAAGNEANLVNSFVDPATVMSTAVNTTDTTKADIVIANHHRIYGDGISKAVAGATITGLALNTTFYISYMDTLRAGGAVTYLYTTDPLTAGQGMGKHAVGNITTPSTSTSPPRVGGGVRPPGVGYPRELDGPIP